MLHTDITPEDGELDFELVQQSDDFNSLEDFDTTKADADLAIASEEFSLDALLTESMESKQQRENIKASRRRISSGLSNAKEKEELQAAIRAYELKREWRACANVAMFSVQCCLSCTKSQPHFLGYFQRQEHRTSKISRWIRGDQAPIMELPKEVKENAEFVSTCMDCVTSSGWVNSHGRN
jgi:hypothetical protein